MNIAILGAGNIGGTLAQKWAAAGHTIMFGLRETHSPKTEGFLQSLAGIATAGTVKEAVQFGEGVLFAIPSAAMEATAIQLGSRMDGKLLIDATNAFRAPVINNLAALSKYAPSARLVRAFNSLGWEVFANPIIAGQTADHFYCGPEGERRTMDSLISTVGLRPVWIGGIEKAPIVDALGQLWVTLVFDQGKPRRSAFKLLE